MDLILADAGANVLVGSLGYAIAQVLAAVFVGLYLAERVGRRVLLRASAAGAGLCLVVMGLATRLGGATGGGLLVGAGVAFIVAVTLGLSTLSWVYAAEVMPSRVRGVAMALGTVVFWSATFGTVESYASLAARFGEAGVFFGYAVCCGVACAFVHVCCVETRGCSLAEIERRFARLAARDAATGSGGTGDDEEEDMASEAPLLSK